MKTNTAIPAPVRTSGELRSLLEHLRTELDDVNADVIAERNHGRTIAHDSSAFATWDARQTKLQLESRRLTALVENIEAALATAEREEANEHERQRQTAVAAERQTRSDVLLRMDEVCSALATVCSDLEASNARLRKLGVRPLRQTTEIAMAALKHAGNRAFIPLDTVQRAHAAIVHLDGLRDANASLPPSSAMVADESTAA